MARKINPRRLSQLSGKPLSKDQKPAFENRRAEIEAMRASSTVIQPEAPVAVMSVEAAGQAVPELRAQQQGIDFSCDNSSVRELFPLT